MFYSKPKAYAMAAPPDQVISGCIWVCFHPQPIMFFTGQCDVRHTWHLLAFPCLVLVSPAVSVLCRCWHRFPGGWWDRCPWRCLGKEWMWHWGTWLRGMEGELMVGLGRLSGLSSLHDSTIAWHGWLCCGSVKLVHRETGTQTQCV